MEILEEEKKRKCHDEEENELKPKRSFEDVPKRRRIFWYIVALIGFIIAIGMVVYPEQAFEASVRGLNVWWEIVFPALLPFFIAATVLQSIGMVHFMGVILEPLMRPLFRVPGEGAFVMAVGLASGFPLGARLTTDLHKTGKITKEEGERLMGFTNTADPLFMFGAVAVGMLAWPQVGYTIALAHYLSSISTGLLMRFHKPDAEPSKRHESNKSFILFRAARELVEYRTDTPFGGIMKKAITKALSSLLVIGGFIICFSVLIELINASGINDVLASMVGMQGSTLTLITNGLLEVTLGSQEAAQSLLPMDGKIIAISAIIAWSGLSVHGQVAALISDTVMSIKPYVVARLIHGVLAGIYTAIIFRLGMTPSLPTIVMDPATLSTGARYLFATTTMAKVLGVWLGIGVICVIISLIFRMRIFSFKVQSRS